MPPRAGLRLTITAVAAAGLLAGAAAGWVLKPAPLPPAPQPGLVTGMLDTVEDLEKRSAAVVEILNDMAAGRVSRDPGSLEALRDSMQEILGDLGDIKSQMRTLQRLRP